MSVNNAKYTNDQVYQEPYNLNIDDFTYKSYHDQHSSTLIQCPFQHYACDDPTNAQKSH